MNMIEKELPKSYPIVYLILILIVLPILIFGGSPSNKPKVKNSTRELTKKKKPITKKRKSPSKTEAKKDTLDNEKVFEVATPNTKRLSDTDYFTDVQAKYQQNVYSKLDRPKDRTDLVIRYYKKENDDDKVYKLRSLGFYIHERPSDEKYSHLTSNAIFYGDSTERSDIEIIAYTLLKEGFDLKVIAPSIYHDTWKAHSLEIGTDTTAFDLDNYTLSEIRKKWGTN